MLQVLEEVPNKENLIVIGHDVTVVEVEHEHSISEPALESDRKLHSVLMSADVRENWLRCVKSTRKKMETALLGNHMVVENMGCRECSNHKDMVLRMQKVAREWKD